MVDTVISGTSIEDTHKILESTLLEKGNKFQSQRKDVIELLNVHSVIRFPTIRGYHSKWNGLMLEDYIDQWFKPNDQGFTYTYGDRILKYPAYRSKINHHDRTETVEHYVNQLNFVINELKEAPNSRRAVISFYDPPTDSGLEDVPCLQTLQYQIRNNMLFTTVEYRSHDIDAYYPNLCGIAEVSKYIAYMVDPRLYLGEINVYSNNLHKYLHCLE